MQFPQFPSSPIPPIPHSPSLRNEAYEALRIPQRSPEYVGVSLQSMDFADLDLSRSHFVTARGLIASHWNEMRSEEV